MQTRTHLAAGHDGPLVQSSHTSSGTAGTRSSHAHGLTDHVGNAVTPTVAVTVPTAADADGAISAASVFVVSYDDTNVTVRASEASQAFELLVG